MPQFVEVKKLKNVQTFVAALFSYILYVHIRGYQIENFDPNIVPIKGIFRVGTVGAMHP